jgi:hypothetical protein
LNSDAAVKEFIPDPLRPIENQAGPSPILAL